MIPNYVAWVIILARLVKKLHAFSVIQCQLSCSRDLATGTYLNPDQSNLTTLLLWDQFWCYLSEEAGVVELLCLRPASCCYMLGLSFHSEDGVSMILRHPTYALSFHWLHGFISQNNRCENFKTCIVPSHSAGEVQKMWHRTLPALQLVTQRRLCVIHFTAKYHRNCLTGLNCAVNLVLI